MSLAVVGSLLGCAMGPSRSLPTGPVEHDGDTVMVIVAARDLYPGVRITEQDLVAIEIPPVYLPEGVFLTPEHVVGQRPRRRILANELIRASRLANPESGEGLADLVPLGMRIADVPAGPDPAPAYGAFVDVWTTPAGGAPCVLLQSAFVMGVDGSMEPRAEGPAETVQLLVTSGQALQLAGVGQVKLALRNDFDQAVVPEDLCSP